MFYQGCSDLWYHSEHELEDHHANVRGGQVLGDPELRVCGGDVRVDEAQVSQAGS